MKDSETKTILIDPRSIIMVFLIGILLFVLFLLRDLVLVLLTSIVIASFIESAVAKMSRRNIPRAVTVIGMYALCTIILILLFYVFVPIFAEQVSSLVTVLSNYIPDSSILNNLQGPTIVNTKNLVSNISNNMPINELIHNTQVLISGIAGGFIQTASFVFGSLLNLILITIISFYLSMQERGIENFLRIITPDKNEAYIIDLWRRTERKIGLWMQGQMLLGVLIGVLLYLGLTILGVDYSLVLAFLAAVFELIPFGLVLAIIPALGFAYAGGGIVMAVKVLALFVIVQQFENYLIAPLIVKKVIGISPLVVILSLLIGAKLAGFWGVILGIPVAVCLLEYLNDLEKRKTAS